MGKQYAQYANSRETIKGIKFQLNRDVLDVMYNGGVDPRFKDVSAFQVFVISLMLDQEAQASSMI